MSLIDPSNPEELMLGKVAPVSFESVAKKEHKWQVWCHYHLVCISGLKCVAISYTLDRHHLCH